MNSHKKKPLAILCQGKPSPLNPWIQGSIQAWIALKQAVTQKVIGLKAGQVGAQKVS